MRKPLFPPSSDHPPSGAAHGVAIGRRQVGRSRVPLHRRLLIVRSALAYWIAVVLLALTTAAFMVRLLDRAGAAERRFGPVRRVLVSRAPLRAGQGLTTRNTSLESRPIGQLPAGVLDEVPENAAASGPVARGEVLTNARVRATSSEQPSGTATIALPSGEAPLAVRPGDHVDVYATYDPSLTPPGADPTSRVATRAEVIRAARASVTVRVSEAEAAGLAGAVARASVTVALVR